MADNNTSSDLNTQSRNPRIIEQTPREPRSDGKDYKLPSLRPQIAHEMDKEIVVCSVENFMKTYMPFIPEDKHIKGVMDILIRQKIIKDKPPRFTSYQERPTRTNWNGPNGETRAYTPLKAIAEAIGSYEFKDKTRKRNIFHYRNCQNSGIDSAVSGSNHRIDACFTSDSPGLLTTWGIAVSMEHKLDQNERIKNNLQVVSSNVQIMNDDVRRMFTFGMTIESDMVTLWYHSRSHSAASKQFSFLKNPKLLTQIFMCFLFATKAELGYDTNITRAPDGHYIYKIPQKDKKTCRFYRTVRPISQYRSNNITGRMARIFVVQEVDSTSSAQYVLKDVWLDDEAQTEREIQYAIFSDIEKFRCAESTDPMLKKIKSLLSGTLSNKAYKKHFLEIIDDFVGEKSKRVAPNSARTPGLLKLPGLTATLQSFSKALSKASAPTSTTGLDRSSVGTTFSADLNANAVESIPHRSFLPKKRYRVVFKEVCTTVGDLGTLGEVIDVLNQALTPLQLLFCAGWVHRDISSGNVMAHRVDNKWNVKLTDLEYAKKYPPPPGYEPSDDPKTGTPFFMAHEILDLHQLHSNATKVAPPLDPDDIFAFPAEVNRPVPIHNFQHDLESVWWILLYTITLRVKNSPSKALGYARMVFQNSNGLSKARRDCFVDSIRAKLNEVLLEDVRAFDIPMEWMRSRLHKGYVDREKDGLLREIGSYIEIHSQFANFLGRLTGLDANGRPPTWLQVPLTTHSPYQLIIASESPASQSASSINPGDIPARVNKRPLPGQDEDDDSKDHKGSANKNGLAARMRPASKRSKRDEGNN